MKKVLFVGMVFGALALTSCKKDYTCTFKTPAIDMGGITFPAQEITTDHNDVKKSDAKDLEKECKGAGGTWASK